MGTIKEKKYFVIKNFLTQSEIGMLDTYTKLKHKFNRTSFSIQNNNEDTGFYGDLIMESLLQEKLPIVEKESGLKLLPTYSYWRMYTMYSSLHKHKDRPACEISVTVSIGNCGTEWPIYMDGNPITLFPGDAAIYLGMDTEHWREEFTGDYNAQVFLHYVDANGEHSNCKYDERLGLGYPLNE